MLHGTQLDMVYSEVLHSMHEWDADNSRLREYMGNIPMLEKFYIFLRSIF